MAGAANAIGGPIVRKDAAERIVTAPVLVPGEPDRERHQYTEENIEHVARSFFSSGEIDAMHAGGEVGHPTESYIAPQDLTFEDVGRTVPAGTWVVSAKVTDDDVWAGVADGTYQGLSVFGPVRRVLDAEGNELPFEQITRPVNGDGPASVANSFAGSGIEHELMPAPVGTSWTVEFERATHASIVDDPAVQAASFVVAKSASDAGSETPTMDDEFTERFNTLQTAVEKSADAAQAAQESAEQAQETAETALEGADGGDGDGDAGGSPDSGLTQEAVRSIVEDTVADAVGDIEAAHDTIGDLDDDTIETLVEADLLDADDLKNVPSSGVEKRLAAIEKSLQQGGTRQGFGTQLDLGGDGEGDDSPGLVDSDARAAAIKNAGSAFTGDDDE